MPKRKLRPGMEVVSFLSIPTGMYEDVEKWIKENIAPTYIDSDREMKEDLFSIACEHGHFVPTNVKLFYSMVSDNGTDCSYFRFQMT